MQPGWHFGVLDPQGPVGAAERTILLDATTVMLAVIMPIILLTLGFAWWFRAGNGRARYLPDWEYSGPIELVVWSVPALVVMFLGGIGWLASHDLDPRAPLQSTAQPIDIQVVSLDWKWLFIYPAQGIASVNRLVVPASVPIRFELTSATVMNSFFVPQLGSQIYTMSGMTTHLNLLADRSGMFPGLSAQFSGDGFSDMRFQVEAMPQDQFAAWLDRTHAGATTLDAASYTKLAQHGTSGEATFGKVMPDLFQSVVKGDVSPTGK